jgi:galactokinase
VTVVVARAPGRVNLIGDHTDYTGGLVLPMAIDRATTVRLQPGGPVLELVSSADPEAARLSVADAALRPSAVEPAWARYVAGVVAVVRPSVGGHGTVESDVPVGAGLSSSAALEVAVALALGFRGTTLALAQACQEAEHVATGLPTGIMDQLASAAGVAGHALLIDCTSLDVTPIPVPAEADVVVVDSGERRALVASAYTERRDQCEAAARIIGPLRSATVEDVERLDDDVLRRRARHVVTENARVAAFAAALAARDLPTAGRLMAESHASLRDDFEVSTPGLDAIVARLSKIEGVYGARLTGAGFGGCVVALARSGALGEGWHFRPAAGATVEVQDGVSRD